MSEGVRVGQNISIILLSDISASIIGFVYFIHVAKYFGALDFGILSFAIATTSLLSNFINFGTTQLFIRDIARDNSVIPNIIGNSFIIKLVFTFIAFALLTCYLKLFHYEVDTCIVLYIIFVSTIISSITTVFESVFQALEKPIYGSIAKILRATLLLLGLYVAMNFEWNIVLFSTLHIVTSFIILSIYTIQFKKYIEIKNWFGFDLDYIKYILKEAWPFLITSMFVSIYVWTDSIMLSILKSEVEVGYYNAAYQLVLALLFIPIAFNTAVYPVLSRNYISGSEKSMKSIIDKYFTIMMGLGIPIGVGTTLLGTKIIEIAYGPEYFHSVIVLQILIWSLVFTYMNAPFAKLFESINMQIMITKITGISVVINIIINYLLIPRYSIIGASIATLITEATVAVLLMLFSIKLGLYKFNYISFFKIIIGNLCMSGFIYCTNGWNIIISIICSALLYIFMLYVLKVISNEDIVLMKSIAKRARLFNILRDCQNLS